MTSKQILPIKVVFPSKPDYRPPHRARKDHKLFVPVTNELRSDLAAQAAKVLRHFKTSFGSQPDVPVVARVSLRKEALAKSHRPNRLFRDESCPVIGVDDSGQLLVSVTPKGMRSIESEIRMGQAEEVVANISAVTAIEPWTASDATHERSTAEIAQEVAKRKKSTVRCELFRHKTQLANDAIRRTFLQLVRDLKLAAPTEVRYTTNSTVFSVSASTEKQLDAVASFAGVQSLSNFPIYGVVRPASSAIGSLTPNLLPPPDSGRSYGVVGLIDTGTDPHNKQLQAWVVDRLDIVPRELQVHSHGSFVGGLIAASRSLNHGDTRFPDASAKIVDVVVFDDTCLADEHDLLSAIDQAIARYPHVKVWNLSIGRSSSCDKSEFSDFAAALDTRSSEHGILFVIAAGNYETIPLRGWPPPADLDSDRISPPADAVRGLTVGSIAHKTTAATLVADGEPSPFSRRGPAPGYVWKPELAHYGGNCSAGGTYTQSGVISTNGREQLAEDIGTSFSTPIVSALAAAVWNELDTGNEPVSPLLVKALIVHSAFLKGAPEDLRSMHYGGLGTPGDLDEVLGCTQSSATIILQIPVSARGYFEKTPFPMPSCLESSSGLCAEVFMTLAHDSPLDPAYGFEYCRSNVTASLGIYPVVDAATGKRRHQGKVPSMPPNVSNGVESNLIEHGHKWSPLKLYYKKFSRGPTGEDWRCLLDRLDRAESPSQEEQTVFLIVTIRDADPERKAKVYDEIVRTMSQFGWLVQDLRVRSRERQRT